MANAEILIPTANIPVTTPAPADLVSTEIVPEYTPIIIRQINNTFGRLGILPLLSKDGVTEVVINEENVIYYEEYSRWQRLEAPGNESDSLIQGLGTLLINNAGQSQRFDNNHPMLSLTMPGGERVQLVRQPAVESCSLTVRIPSQSRYTLAQYEQSGLFDRIVPMSDAISDQDRELQKLLTEKNYRDFIIRAVEYRKNIVVSGATGSGKTTFMKSLLDLVPHEERIITIEDAREIFISHPNKVHLIYPKSKSEGTVTAKSCLEATLRMKPDRIILAEIRGDEGFYFVRACGNGHSGSMTSCHADSALMAYEQIALMINAAPEGAALSYDVIRRLIFMTIDISIHFANIGGRRFITGIDFDPERKMRMLKHEG